MSTTVRDTQSLSMSALSLVLIGPHEERRRALAKALAGPQARVARELKEYPQVDDLEQIIEADSDVLVIDLDPNPELALDIVETVCGRDASVTAVWRACPVKKMIDVSMIANSSAAKGKRISANSEAGPPPSSLQKRSRTVSPPGRRFAASFA